MGHRSAESTLRVWATLQAPAAARRFIDVGLYGFSDQEDRQTASLLTSELVTNALVHTDATYIDVAMHVDRCIRVEVSDPSSGAVRPLQNRPDEPGGLGLQLVEALAHRWGTETLRGNGKVVWFELRNRRTPG